MTERLRSEGGNIHNPKVMANDIGPRKSMFVIVIVVGCFAVLWPKVFYPMLVGSAKEQMKPSSIDKTTGCCDVISETDVNTIKIMSELCRSFVSKSEEKPLSGKGLVSQCKAEVLKTCGIDISAVLQEKVMLGHTFKQILDEVRSLNGSLCLKYNFGVPPWTLGIRHIVPVNINLPSVQQERPPHLRSEIIHPAFRERGSAIPHTHPTPSRGPPPRIVEGKPGPIPGMRPPMGGAGHIVPPAQKGTSMSVIMPIYTVGIVIFFTYTLMKLLFKKQPDSMGGPLYPPISPDTRFRKEVFESAERPYVAPRPVNKTNTKLGWKERDAIVNAMSGLLDEVDKEIEARRKALEVAKQPETSTVVGNGNLSNGDAIKAQDIERPSVKVLGMEMTASCEGGEKWSNNPATSVLPTVITSPPETKEPPQEIYLEGALPAQSRLLVSDSATETQHSDKSDDPAVVLSGKMTLSVIADDFVDGSQTADAHETKDTEINGDNFDDEHIEDSKYTTASSATAAENDVSEEEHSNEENGEDNIEDIEEDEIGITNEDNKSNQVNSFSEE